MRSPALGELPHLLLCCHVLSAEQLLRKVLHDGEIAGGKCVRPAEPPHQRNFRGPTTHTAQGDQAIDHLLVRQSIEV